MLEEWLWKVTSCYRNAFWGAIDLRLQPNRCKNLLRLESLYVWLATSLASTPQLPGTALLYSLQP
jgi:hypothetical protein